MKPTRPVSLACLTVALVGSASAACHKKLTAEAIEASPAAIVQKGRSGTGTWIVGSDGAVSATLKDPDGKPIAGTVTGQVTFATPNGPPTSVPVEADPNTGVVSAVGPKLDADITPMSYALTVGGKPWTGSIDVPLGGTQDLAAMSALQASVPPSTVGPNGGVVQVVGPDRIELVANKNTGDVRAYVLDPDNKPIDPGDRKITVALQGEAPEVLLLAPEPQAHFVVGHLRTRLDPAQVTIAVNARGKTHACLVGWAPGSVVVMGPAAPRVHLLAVDAWPGEVVDFRGGHGRHHEITVGGPGVEIGAPGVMVGAPGVVVGAQVGLPGVAVGGPGVVVGAPGVVVGPPGVVGGGGVVVGRPGVVVGGPGREHEREHEHGGGRHH